jgi:hypothetical protein
MFAVRRGACRETLKEEKSNAVAMKATVELFDEELLEILELTEERQLLTRSAHG